MRLVSHVAFTFISKVRIRSKVIGFHLLASLHRRALFVRDFTDAVGSRCPAFGSLWDIFPLTYSVQKVPSHFIYSVGAYSPTDSSSVQVHASWMWTLSVGLSLYKSCYLESKTVATKYSSTHVLFLYIFIYSLKTIKSLNRHVVALMLVQLYT